MASSPFAKPGRNEPCWCGSGKKYKHCHLREDQDASRSARPGAGEAVSPFPLATSRPSTREIASELFKAPERTPEQAAADAEFDRFEAADAAGKVAIFLQRVDEQRLDADDAFEMLLSIREVIHTGVDAAARGQFRKLAERLQESLPEVYEHERGFLLESLVSDAVAEQDWGRVAGLLPQLAEIAHKNSAEFFHVLEALSYHGQTELVIETTRTAWLPFVDSSNLTDYSTNALGGVLLDANLFRYLETTPDPHVDDPALGEGLPEGLAYEMAELAKALQHLSSSTGAWQPTDFDERVDADTWLENVNALLYEFIAEQHRSAQVPLLRGRFMQDTMRVLLREELGQPSPAPAKPKRGSAARSHPLVPQHGSLDRTIGAQFSMLGGSEPYSAAALLELLPAYLHFLARLGLIHPAEMDTALSELSPLVGPSIELTRGFGADAHAIRNVKAAWSEPALNALRSDPALAGARGRPQAIGRLAPDPLADARSYRFRVTYLRVKDVWFDVEIQRDQTLHDLHRAILKAAGYDDDHLYSFFLSGRAWDKDTEYSGSPGRRSSGIKIGKLPLRLKQRFLYIYDYGDEHRFEVQLIDVGSGSLSSLRILEQHGKVPPQYEWEEDEPDDDELEDDELDEDE